MARTVEPKTQAVRTLIDENGNDLTWADAQPLLKALGFTENACSAKKKIDQNDFNVKKHLYLKSKDEVVVRERKPAKATSKKKTVVTAPIVDTMAAVAKAGGIDSLRAKLTKSNEDLVKMQERLASAQARMEATQAKVDEMTTLIAGFEQLEQAFKAAS